MTIEKRDYITKEDIVNVSQSVSVKDYLVSRGSSFQGDNVSCPICGSNASTRTGRLKCFGKCSQLLDVVDLHKELEHFPDIYSACRDLMGIYGISSVSKYQADQVSQRNKNVVFKNESIKHITALYDQFVRRYEASGDDAIVYYIMRLLDLIERVEGRNTFTEEERNQIRKEYAEYRKYYQNML